MKKKISILLILLSFVLVGCGKESKLKNFDEEKIVKLSKESIELVNKEEYKKLVDDYFDDSVKDMINPDELQPVMDTYIEKIGAFKEFEEYDVVEEEKDGKNYCGLVYEVKHEKGNLIYSVGYNKDYKIFQFFIKEKGK